MYTQKSIETLVQNELQGLCTNCANANQCAYRNSTNKIIIQCELYQLKKVKVATWHEPKKENGMSERSGKPIGLCMNCSRAQSCHLPDRHHGVWHCEEYT